MAETKTQKKTTKTTTKKALEAVVYDAGGANVDTVTLPEAVFGARWRPDLVHQVVVAQESNARQGTAHAKDRSEVRGGGRKPWKQKGTGRARHGSRRSPIWVGGGVTHGPRKERNYEKRVPKKMRLGALASALSRKIADNEVLFVSDLGLSAPKTSDAKRILGALARVSGFETLAGKKQNAALIVLPEDDATVVRSFANFGNSAVTTAKDLNVLAVMKYKYLIVTHPDESVPVLVGRVQNI